MSRRPRARKRPRTGRKRRPVRRKGRVFLPLAVVFLVAASVVLLYLHVSLWRQFEGRLWMLPSRVYSDVLMLSPGDRLGPSELGSRLDRSGYARLAADPERPGQYRVDGSTLDVHLRPFRAGGFALESRRLRLRFRGRSLSTITDGRGRRVQDALIEPELLATLFGPRQEERIPVPLEQVPADLRHAVLSAEDVRFYDHHGLDLRGILRAAATNLRHRRIVQGGSTVTQQTVKNLFLGHERTWWRKAQEGLMAVLLDARYSKDRILEVYLNEVYLGQRGPVAVCGVAAASRFYFGRDVQDLSLAESALLAGLISSPGRYNPFVHPEQALERRNLVLDALERRALVEPGRAEAARAEKLGLASGRGGFSGAAYAVDFVRSQLGDLFPERILRQEGLSIYTTLDTFWQERAEAALTGGLERLDARRRNTRSEPLEGAIVVTRPDTGAVVALVGGRDYERSQFNRAVQARRQPGSCFKPIVFAAGFQQAMRGPGAGLTAASILEDSPLEMRSGGEEWRPANYDRRFRGSVSARETLVDSLNVPTVRAATGIGLETVLQTAREMGITSPLSPLPSLALGAAEVTPLELASAYGTLARMGRQEPAWVIREVVDREGRTLATQEAAWTRALTPQTAWLVNDVLRGVLRHGTGRSAYSLGYRGSAAGKTGTTDDTRDSWFVGYTPDLLALVWVGYDDNGKTGLTGATGALPIWVDLMKRGGAERSDGSFPEPRGLVRRRIDPGTGGLAERGCPGWIDEWFAEGTEPTSPCEQHGGRFRRWFEKVTGQSAPD